MKSNELAYKIGCGIATTFLVLFIIPTLFIYDTIKKGIDYE